MDLEFKRRFSARWERYFPGAELPLALYYTDEQGRGQPPQPAQGSRCLICDLSQARAGQSLRFDGDTVRCSGGRRYLGFTQSLRPNFAHFLSCGIPGELEGERYKKSPALVDEYLKHQPPFVAPDKYILFKRWDRLGQEDDPAVVVFFAPPDALSGLFTLANYDELEPQAVIAPFGAGCASIVYHPYRELASEHPRAVLGMFDVSARPCVPAGVLTFAVPWPKFMRMVENMEESFLITGSWDKVRSRVQRRMG
jgi:hypothetical protein